MDKVIHVGRAALAVCAVLLALWSAAHSQTTQPASQNLSDAEIRNRLIQESIAAYSGACPCPENRNSRGARCGGNSAYSRAGGNRPLCYPSDVTDAMIRRYREALPK